MKNISQAEVQSILSARNEKPFSSFGDFRKRTRCDCSTIENLVNCGGFDSFGISRGKLLWVLGEMSHKAKKHTVGVCLQAATLDVDDAEDEEQWANLPDLPEPSLHKFVQADYDILGLSAICHPMLFYREKLTKARMQRTVDLKNLPDNTIVNIAGVVVVCMRPPTKSGVIVVFLTLEDETGVADCVVFPKVYEKYGTVIFNNPALIIEGKVQKMGKGISVIARKVRVLTPAYRSEESTDVRPFKERIRIAGTRSFVRSAGV